MKSLNNKFISFCLKRRLGKNMLSIKLIFFVMSILEKFETYVNTKDVGKKAHYVPVFILKRFGIVKDKSRLGQLANYSKAKMKFDYDTVKKTAQEMDLYSFREKKSGDLSDFTEKKVFGKIELFASRVIDRLVNTNTTYEFTSLESSLISTFIALQICRTPSFYKNLEKYLLFLLEKNGFNFKERLFIDDHTMDIDEVRRVIINNLYNVTSSQLREFDPQILITGKSKKSIIQMMASEIFVYLAEEIHKKNINIISTKENNMGNFLVSDNPVVLAKLPYEGICTFPTWWDISNKDLFILMPISPGRALFLTSGAKKTGGNYEKKESSLVDLCNYGQFLGSNEYVYSDDMTFLKKSEVFFRNELLSQS